MLLNTHVSSVIVLVISLIPDVNLSSFPITACIPLYCTTVTYLIIIIFFNCSLSLVMYIFAMKMQQPGSLSLFHLE